jgi:mannonate dehydratase
VKIALSTGDSAEAVQFIKELGLHDVVSGLAASPSGVLAYEDIVRRKEFFAAAGLSWDVVENLPGEHYDRCMFGLPGRDVQIDRVCESIANLGRAGIGVLQYQWMLLGGLRTEYSPTGRGGARYSRFDLAVAQRSPAAALDWLSKTGYVHVPDRDLSSEQVWDNLIYFLERVVPAAEDAGVKLAVHPDDAPIPSYMGVARIMVNWDALQRVIDAVPSPCNGIGFCMGTVATMVDMDVIQAIRHFGSQDRIFFGHFRNPRGRAARFDEVFPDEGDTDMVEAVKAWAEIGFDGVIRVDHCPGVIGDNSRADRSFAYQVGYLQGLVASLSRLSDTAPETSRKTEGTQA